MGRDACVGRGAWEGGGARECGGAREGGGSRVGRDAWAVEVSGGSEDMSWQKKKDLETGPPLSGVCGRHEIKQRKSRWHTRQADKAPSDAHYVITAVSQQHGPGLTPFITASPGGHGPPGSALPL